MREPLGHRTGAYGGGMCEQVEKVGVEVLTDQEGVLDLPSPPVGGGGADLAADEG